ncbi:uncharacterized protein [Castor canadensis]|uniref:Uncharacterized protein n=1 Tax=Castor canadensis TaxID=51338 RepID=A0AC58KUB2_CASCN
MNIVQAVWWWCPDVLCVPLRSEEGVLQFHELRLARKQGGSRWPCVMSVDSMSGQWSKGMRVWESSCLAAVGLCCYHRQLSCTPTHLAPGPSVLPRVSALWHASGYARGFVSERVSAADGRIAPTHSGRVRVAEIPSSPSFPGASCSALWPASCLGIGPTLSCQGLGTCALACFKARTARGAAGCIRGCLKGAAAAVVLLCRQLQRQWRQASCLHFCTGGRAYRVRDGIACGDGGDL